MSAPAILGVEMKALRLPLLLALWFFAAACSRPVPRLEGGVRRAEPWRQETVDKMAKYLPDRMFASSMHRISLHRWTGLGA